MKVLRVDGGSETVVETVTKDVKVGGKGPPTVRDGGGKKGGRSRAHRAHRG